MKKKTNTKLLYVQNEYLAASAGYHASPKSIDTTARSATTTPNKFSATTCQPIQYGSNARRSAAIHVHVECSGTRW